MLATPEPVLCRDADELPAGSQWAYQLKVDGFFDLLANLVARTPLTSRSGKALGQHFPELEDPSGRSLHEIRGIRDQIDRRVQALLAKLTTTIASSR